NDRHRCRPSKAANTANARDVTDRPACLALPAIALPPDPRLLLDGSIIFSDMFVKRTSVRIAFVCVIVVWYPVSLSHPCRQEPHDIRLRRGPNTIRPFRRSAS